MAFAPRRIPPTAVVHQEGVIVLIALVGLGVRDGSPIPGLAGAPAGVAVGLAAGLAAAVALYAVRRLAPVDAMTRWQRTMVAGWSATDAIAVALVSGLAEEALVRALLQPLIGLVLAALVFALLHVIPDRRVWAWPVMAFLLGLGLGELFTRWGFPAAAAAHVALNAVGLLRLRGDEGGAGGDGSAS